jgi:hypothetical protein
MVPSLHNLEQSLELKLKRKPKRNEGNFLLAKSVFCVKCGRTDYKKGTD